jgi:cobalt-zinc-cadmium efflux system membrane fusion protein
MKFILILSGLALLVSCGRKEESKVDAAAAVPAMGEQRLPDGTVIIPANSPKLQQIRVETVKTRQVPWEEVVSPGTIQTNPTLVSRVMLPAAGRVAAVLVKVGDSVNRGQPVLTLESPDADAAESTYRQAQAALTTAQANLNKAQADYDRATDLFQHDAVAKKDVLTAENALATSKASVSQSQAALEQAALRLQIFGLKPGSFSQKLVVPAPISGKVLELSIAPGEFRNDLNAPVMTIADLSTVLVSADVPENSIRFITRGERIDVSLNAYPGETFSGRVSRISDTVDPQTRTVKVLAEMDNRSGRLRPEMFGTIRHTHSTRALPVVPVPAVVQGDGKTSVWVESEPGRFHPQEVQTGERVDDVLPVLSGLRAGERVVVEGVMLLRAQ